MKEEYKSIIDSNGNMICNCVLFIEDIPQCFVMNEECKSVDFCMGNFVKPKWNGQEWIESATEEEIEAWKEENKPIENIGENLIDKLILDNINMQSQIDSLIQAQLGGN